MRSGDALRFHHMHALCLWDGWRSKNPKEFARGIMGPSAVTQCASASRNRGENGGDLA
jgi:hypothetical protein